MNDATNSLKSLSSCIRSEHSLSKYFDGRDAFSGRHRSPELPITVFTDLKALYDECHVAGRSRPGYTAILPTDLPDRDPRAAV